MNVEDRVNDSLKRIEEVIESGNVNGRALRNAIRAIVLKSRLDQIEEVKEKEEEKYEDPISVFIEHAKTDKEPPKSWDQIRKEMEDFLNSPPVMYKYMFGYYKCPDCGCERGSNPAVNTKSIPRCPMCKKGIMRFVNAIR